MAKKGHTAAMEEGMKGGGTKVKLFSSRHAMPGYQVPFLRRKRTNFFVPTSRPQGGGGGGGS